MEETIKKDKKGTIKKYCPSCDYELIFLRNINNGTEWKCSQCSRGLTVFRYG